MPNWCHSTLEITGPKNEIASIIQTELDFEKILPTPEDLLFGTMSRLSEFQRQTNIAVFGYEDWYWWRVDNWGTKWTGNISDTHYSPEKINLTMDTAWSLPMELLQKLSVENPNVIIHIIDCEEESGEFVGSCKVQNGKIIEDNIHTPSTEELRDRDMLCEEQ